jgi:hypothetical protein
VEGVTAATLALGLLLLLGLRLGVLAVAEVLDSSQHSSSSSSK